MSGIYNPTPAGEIRPCLVCDDPAELHDTDPETAEHVYEPEHPTPAEASTIVAWVRENHGDEAAAETARDLVAKGAEPIGLVADLANEEA
ncbi:hypothetical protein [Streptomyces mirabilis]|uniref:hypothetical protein n=1 Tax=Streptomyces mirabilis TaxID=68239 RepID=UPI00332FDD70